MTGASDGIFRHSSVSAVRFGLVKALIGPIDDALDRIALTIRTDADTDGDGRVNLQEAMAFDQGETDVSVASSTETTAASDESETIDENVMLQIMRLVQAYNMADIASSDSASTVDLSA
jgi:hypothetical protein